MVHNQKINNFFNYGNIVKLFVKYVFKINVFVMFSRFFFKFNKVKTNVLKVKCIINK